jgi:hypothetical protein
MLAEIFHSVQRLPSPGNGDQTIIALAWQGSVDPASVEKRAPVSGERQVVSGVLA